MEYPGDLKFTKEHEWIRLENGKATVGITEFAQSELGEIVFVELPEVGATVEAGESMCVAESTKAASDIYAPVNGKVAEVNSALTDSPDLVNASPYDEGWMVKLEDVDVSQVDSLMGADEYREYVESHK